MNQIRSLMLKLSAKNELSLLCVKHCDDRDGGPVDRVHACPSQ